MIVQLKDCVYALKSLHSEFDFIFLFDHTNGQNRLQPDGLNVNKIGIKYGGSQSIMRKCKITKKHFGPYHTPISKLQQGMMQFMQFTKEDEGPCNLSPKKRLKQRLDDHTSNKIHTKDFKCADLIKHLKASGYPREPKGNKNKLQQLAIEHRLPIKYHTPKPKKSVTANRNEPFKSSTKED